MQPHGGMQGALEVMGGNEGDMGLLKKHDWVVAAMMLPGGTGHSCPLPHTPAISSVAYTRGAAGSWSSASRLVFAYTPRRRWGPTGSQRRRPTDVHTATTTHLNFVQV